MTLSEKRSLKLGLLFISPWILGFAIFVAYPFLASIYFSFCYYNIFEPPRLLGLDNYKNLLSDRVFWIAIGNTFLYATLIIPLCFLVSLSLALLLNAGTRGQALFRVIFYLPSLVPMVALSILWLWIFNGEFGIFNQFLIKLGVETPPAWLLHPFLAKLAIVFMGLWTLGQSIIIYLAALQEVPKSLLEAAELDGACWRHKLRHIILPAISPSILFNVLMGIIGSFQIFAAPYIMTNGGPGKSTTFYLLYLYQKAFEDYDMGYASAMAWILFVIIFALTFLAMRVSRNKISYMD